jgi:MarR family transcriptional regulator, organic hydroperoxide resistance regulator
MAASRDREGQRPESVGLGEVIEFMRLLWAVDHGLEASSKQMDAVFGVTGPQRLVIRIVGRHPGIAAGRIAEILHVHPSTLTGVLGRLVQRGILTRQVDPTDGRRALLALTAQGKKLDELRSGTIEAKVRHGLGKVSAREIMAARRVLSSVAESLSSTPRRRAAATGSRATADPARPAATRPRAKRGAA